MQTKIVSTKNRQCAAQAANVLRAGGVVAYPTETSYALGCDATNSKAIEKIYSLKGRGKGKPLPVIVDSLKTIEKYALLSKDAKILVKKFMPGPLTLVVQMRKDALPKSLSKGGVAFRISSNSFARKLSTKLGRPIVSTSANTSGEASIYSGAQLAEKYAGKIDFIADGGKLVPRKASAIVYLRGAPTLVRPGAVSFQKVLQALKQERK